MRFPWQRRRDARDAALDEELRAHLAMVVADRIARGESAEDALVAARREFGNVTHVKEVTREAWGGAWIERLMQDLRYAARSLRRSPSFTIVAVVTLALGIGVNSAMFTVMNGIMLQPLPFPDPERVIAVGYNTQDAAYDGMSDHHYVALRDGIAPRLFEHLATYTNANVTLSGDGDPVRIFGAESTTDFFGVFGVRARLGRTFDADARVVVLSDRLWRTRFNADAAIIGRSVGIDSVKRTVIGVMPASFDVPAGADFWIPMTLVTHEGRSWNRAVVARLRRDVPLDQARSLWATAAAGFELEPRKSRSSYTADLIPLKRLIVGDARRPLLVFSGAVAFVLLIACANVANLLLMRFASRDREMAVRAALGAGRRRLIRQLLTEIFVMSAAGAVLGVGIAALGVKLLMTIAPAESMPRIANVHLDGTVLAFTAALVLATTAICGLVPALHATESGLRASLAEGARSVTAGRGRLRSALVIGEIGLALVLLVGAALMLRSFQRMQQVDLGFDGAHRLTTNVSLPADRYRTGAEIKAFHDRVMSDLTRIPGAQEVAAVNWMPFTGMMIDGPTRVDGAPDVDFTTNRLVVTPRYFAAIGQRLLGGREFTGADRESAPRVVIVSKSVADRVAPNGNAVGKRIALSPTPEPEDWRTIVGVVDDVVQNNVTDRRQATVYQPMAQVDFPFFIANIHYVVHTTNDQAAAIRAVIRHADPLLPVEPVRELSDLVQSSMLTPRFQARVLAAFAVLALALAMIGIYGVLAYGVAQRRQEIGVRVALGATARDVRGLVLRQTARLAIVGLALGVVASLAVTRVLSRFLFQITPTDPPTFVGVVLILGGVALAAAYLPARRASRVDPLVALRRD